MPTRIQGAYIAKAMSGGIELRASRLEAHDCTFRRFSGVRMSVCFSRSLFHSTYLRTPRRPPTSSPTNSYHQINCAGVVCAALGSSFYANRCTFMDNVCYEVLGAGVATADGRDVTRGAAVVAIHDSVFRNNSCSVSLSESAQRALQS